MVWFLMNLGCIARATPTEKKWETRTSNLRQNQKHTSSLLPFSNAISINTVSHPLTVSFSFSLSLSLSLSLNHRFLCIMFTPHQKGHTKLWFFSTPFLNWSLKSFPFDVKPKKLDFVNTRLSLPLLKIYLV